MKNKSNIILHQMEVGPMQNFQYFIGDPQSKEIAVVDPAWDVDFLCDEIKKPGYKVTAVFLTHGHPDHTNGVSEFIKRHNVPIYISKHEIGILKPRHKNLIEVEDRQIWHDVVGSVQNRSDQARIGHLRRKPEIAAEVANHVHRERKQS